MSEPKENLRILELYSGIGGMHYAAKLAELPYEVVLSLDINTSANTIYRFNFPGTNQQSRNIESLSIKEVRKLKPDVIMMSPPCQPFTRVGNKLDVKDPRCSSFLHLVEILPHLESVSYILMENVVGFESSEMRKLFLESLKMGKFFFREFLLTPESLGIPNSRTRYYLLARKSGDFSLGSTTEIITEIPNCNCDSQLETHYCTKCNNLRLAPSRKPERAILQSYLENTIEDDIEDYLLAEKTLSKYGQILDIRQMSDNSSCCFTKAYSHYAEGTGSVLQHNSSESLDKQFSKFKEDSDISHLKILQLRYFTPCEVANLMGFPPDFKFPDGISNRTKYRVLGNSLNIVVVSNLFRLLTST
nr:EOG090X0A4V [Sida crystallina]